ncbi:hypothetical protein DICVIV_14071 [Dictyocaulus viviparus]|uniref:Thioredoxin-like fold domain-containing protein n=1 Tax=Dictyocaulus viviparus TaxID=29172 RepID=A0A0D8XC18_DICVI|nr:hypothetical protein DICVIV_14071 [Dictyocaulus viviparus]
MLFTGAFASVIYGSCKMINFFTAAFMVTMMAYKDEVFESTYPYLGNENSNVIAVGFFDYCCGYCKAIKDDVKQLINDGKVKYIFRDTPVLGNDSLKAARSALAVYFIDKGRYFDFYYAVLDYKGELSNENILGIVKA